jgi:AraC-like DNA-binding protein
MNPNRMLVPDFTATQAEEHLSARHPIRVLTHVFDPLDPGAVPSDYGKIICGEGYPIHARREILAHDHEHYEISLVTGGTALHRTPMYDSVVGRGCVMVLAPGKLHGYETMDGLTIVNCIYLPEWLFYDVKELWTMEGLIPLFLATGFFSHPESSWVPQYTLNEEEFQICVHELQDIGRECNREDPSLSYLKWGLQKLMLTLSRAFSRQDSLEERMSYQWEIQMTLERMESIISQCEPFSVSELASGVKMSPDYFSRIFKHATGLSPMDYFQRRRIQHASWLLINARHSITDVAHVLGFCDSAHFSHLFKKHQGISPKQYQKRYIRQA